MEAAMDTLDKLDALDGQRMVPWAGVSWPRAGFGGVADGAQEAAEGEGQAAEGADGAESAATQGAEGEGEAELEGQAAEGAPVAAEGEGQAEAAAAGEVEDGKGKRSGDVGKALHVERERRRVADEVNRRLRERLDALVQQEPEKGRRLEIGDEDILDGRQVKRLFEEQRVQLRQDVGRMVQAQMRATELMGFVDSFEAFSLETGIGALGREALTARLAAIKSVATPEGLAEAKATVEAVARQVSEGHAAGHNAELGRGTRGARTVAPGPGAATATRVVIRRDAPATLEGMHAEAAKSVGGIFRRFRKASGLG
jgi:hypothetical protein